MQPIYSKEKQPVIAIALLTAACLVGDSMLYIVLPTHWREAGLSSLWEVGVLLSANRLIRLPFTPVVGWLYQRISIRTGVLFASVLAILTTLSYGYVQDFWILLTARCVWGIAWTFLRLGGYFAVLDCSENSNRGHLLGLYNGLFRLGSLGGMLLGGFLADRYGLSFTAVFFAAVSLAALPLGLLYVPNCKSECCQEKNKHTVHQVLRNTNVAWALATGLVIALIYQGVFMSTLSHVIKYHETDTIVVANLALGAATLAGLLQAIRWGWEPWVAPWFGRLSDGKNGRRPYLCLTLMLAALLFAFLPFSMPLLAWLTLLLGLQITATALTTLSDAIASDAASAHSKTIVMTSYSFSTDLGAALGPIIAYTLNEFWGAYVAYWFSGLLLLLLAAKWFFSPPLTANASIDSL